MAVLTTQHLNPGFVVMERFGLDVLEALLQRYQPSNGQSDEAKLSELGLLNP
jgi:hypothetical protein